ncbi:MAG: ACP S-malonyltransferase [Atopobiaceae bacterium]|nr:ACP S-malonyltransferase [Atopobiaceae bacterium]
MAGVAFLFAGQGSQKPGMGKALFDSSEAAKKVFDGVDAVRPGTASQCFEGTKEELGQTINTQPCVFATDLAAAAALEDLGVHPNVVAGHSLGEVAALTFAGAFSLEEGTRLIEVRAQAMADCTAKHPGAMRAVLKLDAAKVEELAHEAGEAWPVNYNSPQQTVVAGSAEACEKLDGLVKAAGGRSMKVAVSGAFHSPYMAEATEALAAYLETNPVHAPKLPVLANRTGETYPEDVAEIAALLSEQVSNPVKWTAELHAMQDAGIDTFIEVGPGHTLTGLVKRTLEGVDAVCVETPEAAEEARVLVAGKGLI